MISIMGVRVGYSKIMVRVGKVFNNRGERREGFQ